MGNELSFDPVTAITVVVQTCDLNKSTPAVVPAVARPVVTHSLAVYQISYCTLSLERKRLLTGFSSKSTGLIWSDSPGADESGQPGDTRNSPLWVSNPKQQIAYLGVKYWARLYCPEVILGVYSPDEVEQREEREINPAPVQRMSVQEITSEVSTRTSAQESAANVDAVADDLRERIDTASSVDQAKAIRADIESQKALLGTALFTELKNKAVKRYYQVDAQNKVEAVINSIPNPGEPEAAEMFAKAESTLGAAKRHLGDELHDKYRITLDDMKPEYIG